ncbi:MAG: adenylate/guanylate cyclase domain-containing protein [Verrucomicrobia bacterium]|nr:adenylate/guanylate cyclase domain-containing protein [Verrucomicrobiota bacterium]
MTDELRHFLDSRALSAADSSVEVTALTLADYRKLGNQALAQGETFLAYDIVTEGLRSEPADLRLLQHQALALARSGSPQKANSVLRQLQASGHRDEETLGLLARTHKDLWQLATEPAEKHAELRRCFELYREAYELTHGYYPGINAAAMGLLLSETKIARQLAREVLAICATGDCASEDYWTEATRGEAALISGDLATAAEHYGRAGQLGRGRFADLSSTRRQARLLCDHLLHAPSRFDACFGIPNVVAFSGHMIDAPDRAAPRFPAAAEARVRAELDARLAALDAGFGFCAAACGADLLFIEAMLARGAEVHVVLPLARDAFRRASLENGAPGDWGARYESALQAATSVTYVGKEAAPENAMVFEFGNRMIAGLARIKARTLDTRVFPLAVWDGRAGDGEGGTDAFVRLWQARSIQVELIEPNPEAAISSGNPTMNNPPPAADAPAFPQVIKAMLFADVAGYGKLTDETIPHFVTHFLGRTAGLIARHPDAPLLKNTWGDAFYFVFDTVAAAGRFSLDLRDLIDATPWSELGLPNGLRIRIGLHAGPVFAIVDPIIAQQTFTGFHVSRTARIEPITEEGQIYVSQAFAALAEAEGATRDFVCDYVGQKTLPKKSGVFPFYLLRRRVPAVTTK